ncbi:MAG: VCBS repeat-containing protein, partial [Gemmatimonadetes bacterium]|nr:VCBS repeat-containing protein [Gemmatimonadota bacterium]
MTFPSVHPLDNLSLQAMSPVSSSTIRTPATALFIILIIAPFFLDRWLSPETGVRTTDVHETDAANPGRYGFLLTDATATAGIDFIHEKPELDPKLDPIMPHISALGASVSVVDFDNDGLPDIYVTSSRKGTSNDLYRNKGDGSYAEIAG